MSTTSNAASPFGEIAISLSGGGYRAAAFHLGTLDFLNRLDLLKDCRVLSTVSGGTFTGMLYAVSLFENTSFEDFYRKLYNFLRDTHVIRLAVANLEHQEIDGVKQMPSLIKGAASVYADDGMMGGRRFGQLLLDDPPRFRGLVFNSVEFHNGNSFRFQTNDTGTARIGNGNLTVPKSVAANIRLADIAAASSCFPSAFEPLRFPDDFNWPAGQTVATVRGQLPAGFATPVPLMDGGIYDNQGVDSVKRVYQRDGSEDSVGLFIISDTSQRHERLFDFPVTPRKTGIRLRTVVLLTWILFILALGASIGLLANGLLTYTSADFEWPRALFLFVIPLIFALSIVIALPLVRERFREGLKLVQKTTDLALWPYIRNLTTSDLLSLIDARIKSLIALTSSIFMKRVRDMGFQDINVYPKYHGKLMPNLIYSLDDQERFGDEIKAQGLVPTPTLRGIAKAAEKVPTNLWFTHEKDLRNLIACGQVSACFNLMKYILELDEELRKGRDPELSKVLETTKEFWEKFKEQPDSLVR
jgi:predicted acylesterase/phospholipase RssA